MPDPRLIEQVAGALGAMALVEKDWHVGRVLAQAPRVRLDDHSALCGRYRPADSSTRAMPGDSWANSAAIQDIRVQFEWTEDAPAEAV